MALNRTFILSLKALKKAQLARHEKIWSLFVNIVRCVNNRIFDSAKMANLSAKSERSTSNKMTKFVAKL